MSGGWGSQAKECDTRCLERGYLETQPRTSSLSRLLDQPCLISTSGLHILLDSFKASTKPYKSLPPFHTDHGAPPRQSTASRGARHRGKGRSQTIDSARPPRRSTVALPDNGLAEGVWRGELLYKALPVGTPYKSLPPSRTIHCSSRTVDCSAPAIQLTMCAAIQITAVLGWRDYVLEGQTQGQ